VVLENKKTLSSYGLKDGDSLVIKDLGPQLSWRAVFILEYLGPLIIHQLFFFWRLNTGVLNTTQILAWACITFHFVKREFESIFIHRFSNATMPLKQLFTNSLHYWLMAGVLIGYFLYAPEFESPSMVTVAGSLVVFLVGELGNLYSHVVLRNLRSEGSTTRGIPRGLGFELVSCPNYTFEILAWTAMSVMTGLISMWIFTIMGGAVMCSWALKKHQRYRKEFPNYPKSRKAIIPFIL
jgi:very-long-chain enoyl-CoA reductase